MAKLRLATFNVENLFARFRFKRSIEPEAAVRDGWNAEETAFDIQSPESKRITGQTIKALEADVLCLQEVENLDTLKRFRSRYLGGFRAYEHTVVIDGNDKRLIDVAVISKHPIVHARSYAHLRDGRSEVFSRDCLEVGVDVDGTLLTLFVQHFKSMMGGRANTRARRARQAKEVKKIVQDRFGEDAGRKAFAVLGDFNDYLEEDKQGRSGIAELVEWDQVENVVGRLPAEERWTHYYASGNDYKQLDYLLLSNSLAEANDGEPEILRIGLPLRAELVPVGDRLPDVGEDEPKASDHCPVAMTLTI